MGAWRSLLRAHATLMRQLETQLEQQTGLALADYDVLVQLGARRPGPHLALRHDSSRCAAGR
ncbi:MAG: hypothetical protein E6I48_16305 [Chloroflexi bacterium]|nr:MAG: hypothetical protein E6I48_16305 [Chloroflexota bacterium]